MKVDLSALWQTLTKRAAALLADEPRKVWEEELWITLRHELTHHMEGLAGERSLERKDSEQLEQFRAESGAGQ